MSEVNDKIKAVEGDIEKINLGIEDMKQKLSIAQTTNEQDFLRSQITQLGTEKEQLRTEKEQLRTEKEQLRKKEEDDREMLLISLRMQLKDLKMKDERVESNSICRFKFEQRAASEFTASKTNHCRFCLYNGIKPITFNCPESVRLFLEIDILSNSMFSDSIKHAKKTILAGLPQSMFPEKVSETHSGFSHTQYKPTVQQETGRAIIEFLGTKSELQILCESEKTLQVVKSCCGPATRLSIPDGVAFVRISGQNIPLSCFELKDSAYSPLEQLGQAFASGANLALTQARWGLASSVVAVPLIVTNGQLYQFAMATLLDNIPVLHMLTNVLDATNSSSLDEIAECLVRVSEHMKRQATHLASIGKPTDFDDGSSTEMMSFDVKKYHLKAMSQVFNRFGRISAERKALPLLWDIFEALTGLDGVVMPLGYGELPGINQSGENENLVFKNLFHEGFVLGVPIEERLYKKFCEALKSLVNQIHARNVIHVDLYPSNIFWSNQDEDMKVRIIDWDSATFRGDPFPQSMLERLEKYPSRSYCTKPSATAENDAWHVFILSSLEERQRGMLQGTQAADAGKVNEGYLNCISEMMAQTNEGLADLHAAFLTWFETFQSHGLSTPDA